MNTEGRLRGVLGGLLVFLAATGLVTWCRPRPGVTLQFVQLAHMLVGFAVVALGIAYIALHLVQTLRGGGRSLRSTPRTPFLMVGVLVVGAWLARGEKLVLTNVVQLSLFITAITGLVMAAARLIGLGRAAHVAIGLMGALVLFVLIAIATDTNAPLVLITGFVLAAPFLWAMARSTGSVVKTPGGFGGLAMLTCFISAISGAGAAFGLMPYARPPLLDQLSLPWLVHVLSAWVALVLVVAHIRSSRARSARLRSAPRAYSWREPLQRRALPALIAALLGTVVLAIVGGSNLTSFEGDPAALLPMDTGFSTELPANCESCHPDVVDGWAHSAHAHAANNPLFVALLTKLRDERGPEEVRVCLRCHAPHARDPANASLAAVLDSEGYRAGVHCVSCHRAEPAGDRDGALVSTPLGADGFALLIDRPGVDRALGRVPGAQRLVRNTLISSHLERHRERYRFAIHEPVSCMPCHVQTLGPPTHGRVTDVLQDQYASWRGSPAEAAGMTCASCHMAFYQRDYGTPVHDHRFLAASTYLAGIGRGATGVSDVVAALSGRMPPPTPAEGHAFGDRTPETERALPAAPGPLLIMEVERAAGELVVRTWNSGQIGHAFPTGPTDLFQVWLSVRATDERGRVVLDVGAEGPQGAPQLGDRLFDDRGKRIDDHRLWAVHEIEDLGRIPVAGTHETRLDASALECADAGSTCRFRVDAAWNYRRLDPALIERLTGAAAPDLPVVQVGKVSADVR